MMNLLDAAFRYLDHGLAVIPIWRDARKNPRLTSFAEYQERLPARDEWVRWAQNWPDANLGAITGYWLNYVALDFDDKQIYKLWACGAGLAVCRQTWTVRTKRGYHVWFQVRDDPGRSRMYRYNQAEVLLRARGGYCIVPPSIHHTGAKYATVYRVPPLAIETIVDVLEGWELKQTTRPIAVKFRPVVSGQIRIEDLINIPQGSNPNSRGAYQVYCPFHEDRRPSAWLNVQQQRFGCNACWPGLWWDVVNVYAMLYGISNSEAWRIINNEKATT
jgi:hypothetical protein